MRSLSAFSEGQFATALSHCEKAMKTSPKNAEVLAICLRLFQRNERHEEALEISARIQKLDKDADKKFDLCLIDGISFTKLHLWQQAIDRYESCLSNVKQSEKSLILGNLAEPG